MNDYTGDFWDNKKAVDRRKRNLQAHREKGARERLSNILDKKFSTVTIGALAAFEDNFGYLWGHGQPLEELTPDQREMREYWEETRERILDNGNSNRRAARNEISQYTVTWNRYETEFFVKKDK